jgi:hypothetical protein
MQPLLSMSVTWMPGSVKRVGSAIGEGAAAVAEIHQFLAQLDSMRAAAPAAAAVA